MPCCGRQPLAYLRRELPYRRDVGSRAEDPHKVTDVADATGRGEADGQVQCLPPDNGRLLRLALPRVGGGEQ